MSIKIPDQSATTTGNGPTGVTSDLDKLNLADSIAKYSAQNAPELDYLRHATNDTIITGITAPYKEHAAAINADWFNRGLESAGAFKETASKALLGGAVAGLTVHPVAGLAFGAGIVLTSFVTGSKKDGPTRA